MNSRRSQRTRKNNSASARKLADIFGGDMTPFRTRRSFIKPTLLLAGIFLLAHVSAVAVPYPDGLPIAPADNEIRPQGSSATSGAGDVFCMLDSATVTSSQFDSGSDVWGWEAPDGTEYAIMGVSDGIVFVDVASMQIVQKAMDDCGGGSSWRDMKTFGNYCYAVTECTGAGRGIHVIDISGLPHSIRDLGFVSTDAFFSGWHNMSIDTTLGFLYLAKQNSGFLVYSLADPENPVRVSNFVNTFCHDLYADNDTVWVAEAFDGFWSVWDMSNKNFPNQFARVSVPNPGFVHNIWPSPDRSFAVSTEETLTKTVKIWNTQDLSNVQLVAEYLAPNGIAHNAHVVGDTLYLSHYASGVVSLDLTDPANPVIIDSFDTFPSSESGSGGCWGIFPHTSSGKVYASNMSGELFVFGPVGIRVDNRFGEAPLDVQFTGASCQTVNSWNWTFGDGGTASIQSPMHTFADAGLQSVNLDIQTPSGTFSAGGQGVVAVHAETLWVSDVSGSPNQHIRVDFSVINHLPASGFQIPLNWDGPLSLTFDSVSTQGLRTEFMGPPFQVNLQVENRRAIYSLSSSSQTLPPGDGPVISLFLRMPPFNLPFTNQVASIGYGLVPSATITFPQATVVPVAILPGTVSMGCCKESTGNVDGDPGDIVDIADLTFLIDHLFINFTPLDCPEEGNIDGDPAGIVDIADLTFLIDHLFISFPSTAACQ